MKLTILGRIACTVHRCGLLLQMSHIACSVLGELCKNSWTNRHAIWGGGADSCEPKEQYIRWGSRRPQEGALLRGTWYFGWVWLKIKSVRYLFHFTLQWLHTVYLPPLANVAAQHTFTAVGVTRRRCGLLPNYFRYLSAINTNRPYTILWQARIQHIRWACLSQTFNKGNLPLPNGAA